MLFDIKEFGNPKEYFSTQILFKEDDNNENEKYQYQQALLRKYYNEKCYIYEDYDIHDINYEIKAVGLPKNLYYTSASFGGAQ